MKIIVPTSLDDITLVQYQQYQKLVESKIAIEELTISKLEIFCGINREQVLSIEFLDVHNISDTIDKIIVSQPKLVEKFKVNNIKFGWLPKLDDMSYGELLDLNGNISDWETMHIAMGVLYRPITNEIKDLYSVENYKGDKYHKDLRQMPMSAVISAMVFFWNLGLDCLKYITKSLEVANNQDFQNNLNLVESGLGMRQSMNSLQEMLPSLKR